MSILRNFDRYSFPTESLYKFTELSIYDSFHTGKKEDEEIHMFRKLKRNSLGYLKSTRMVIS